MDKRQLTKYRRTIQTLRARGRIKSETFGDMGQCQRKKGFTLLEVDALKYLLQEFPILKSRDEEIKKLRELILEIYDGLMHQNGIRALRLATLIEETLKEIT